MDQVDQSGGQVSGQPRVRQAVQGEWRAAAVAEDAGDAERFVDEHR
ncbi:hypothetical protein [Streptomyces zhihengii]